MHNPAATLTRRSLLAAGAGAALPACGGGFIGGVPLGRLDAALNDLPRRVRALMRETGVPGVAVAVVQGGETVLAEGFGVRQAGAGAAVDADTVFQLASVSKSIGATVVARQVGEGRVAWDTPLRTLLPWFALSRADSTARLTVGDCYAHRSGLHEHAGDLLEEIGYGQRELLERLRALPVEPLGSAYHYTNMALTAAAVGVAQAAGADWATLSQRTLYAPLGMQRTSSRYADFLAQPNRAATHMLDGGRWQPGPPRNPDAQSPAGGVSASVRDVARWLALLLAQGQAGGRPLVDAAALRAAMRPQMAQGNGGFYGYGFNVGRTDGGLRLVNHSGAFALGAATCFMLLPELDAGIAVLTNAQPQGVPEALCRHFLDVLENGRATDDWWAKYRAAMQGLLAPVGELVGTAPPAQPRPAQPLARYAGSYANAYYGPLRVWQEGGQLHAGLGPTGRWLLRHWSGDCFVFYPGNESAAPGSVSQACFDLAASPRVRLEFFDQPKGMGVFG